MPSRLILSLAALAALALAALAFWALRAPPVSALRAGYAPLVRTLQFSARVATLSRVDVGSTVTGRVCRWLVDEGAQVHAATCWCGWKPTS